MALGYGQVRTDGDRAAVRYERLYDATPDELWAALTDPEQMEGWLAHTSRFELSPGGEVVIDFGSGDEGGGAVRGRMLQVDPPRVLEYSWTFTGEPESVVRFEIVPQAQGVKLVLDHRLLSWDSMRGYGAGWHAHLDQLGNVLRREEVVAWPERYRELRPEYDRRVASARQP